jgi:hypothetical protein
MVKIEIDREKGIVEKTRGFSFWKKRRSWNLGLFDTVRLEEEATTVEEGYGITWYSVFLDSGGASLELLSTENEQRARSLHRELMEALAHQNRG